MKNKLKTTKDFAPYLGCKVSTPEGIGILYRVEAAGNTVGVLFDRDTDYFLDIELKDVEILDK